MIQKYDRRNDNIKVLINGKLYDRSSAKISVFDSLVQGGDGVWEGLRIYDGYIFALEKHINRLLESAKSLMFENIPSKKTILSSIMKTLIANKMFTDVHVRLTLSRGKKITSGMNPKLNQYGCTLIVLAEWKPPIYLNRNLKLITSSIRRNTPLFLDSKIHHNNLLNNILAKIEANNYGADDSIMLDLNGFISETNSTNIFMIKDNIIYTPTSKFCLPGITRELIISICKSHNIPIIEKDISISELYNADQVFTTGTMGEIAEVVEVDNRKIKNTNIDMIENLKSLFNKLKTKEELLTKIISKS